jgi:REP element-mobilizing transposase RayT
VVLPGRAYHITQRGKRRQQVFFCDTDRQMYLNLLRDHASRAGMQILAYCLMPNHVHVVAVPERVDSLAKGFGRTHNEYARWVHIRERQTRHLWQNRFFSCPLDKRRFAEALRYVELNPVRAGLVEDPCEWAWSSAPARINGTDRSCRGDRSSGTACSKAAPSPGTRGRLPAIEIRNFRNAGRVNGNQCLNCLCHGRGQAQSLMVNPFLFVDAEVSCGILIK